MNAIAVPKEDLLIADLLIFLPKSLRMAEVTCS